MVALPSPLRLRALPDERRALLVCAAIAGAVALLLVLVVPTGGDASAHLYRTLLVRHGVLLWDNLWYAGQYPLVSYCLFYYIPAAVLGNALLASAGVLLSALLFASIVLRVWGTAARWPAYWFAALVGGQFFTGDYPYTLAFAALLATLWALQRGLTVLAVACAALTLGCSPLAFLFLCLALVALGPFSSTTRGRALAVAATVAALGAIELGALWLFPSGGLYYPFGMWRLLLGMMIGVFGTALALRSSRAKPLLAVFVVWTVVTFAGYFVASPIGHNFLRPAAVVFPIMLLTAKLADFRPRWLAIPAVAAAFGVNVLPYTTTVIARADDAAKASFWAPLLAYVGHHSTPSFRLEVVPTENHWEAYYVPRAGFAIARGWYQQLDTSNNPSLYAPALTPAGYQRWLRSVGVRYVVLPATQPASESQQEARLLHSGRSGLLEVFASASGSIYELPRATSILTGPAAARLTSLTHSGLAGWVARPGAYLLRVHYTLLWRLRHGSLCLRRAGGDMTRLVLRRAGRFALSARESVSALVGLVTDASATHGLACASSRAPTPRAPLSGH